MSSSSSPGTMTSVMVADVRPEMVLTGVISPSHSFPAVPAVSHIILYVWSLSLMSDVTAKLILPKLKRVPMSTAWLNFAFTSAYVAGFGVTLYSLALKIRYARLAVVANVSVIIVLAMIYASASSMAAGANAS